MDTMTLDEIIRRANGEEITILILSGTRTRARSLFSALAATMPVARKVEANGLEQLDLLSGSTVRVRSGRQMLRGSSADLVVLDGFEPNDAELSELTPIIASRAGGRVVALA